jgi:hypothetical protein
MHIELNVQALQDHARRVGIDPDRFYCRELSQRLGVGPSTEVRWPRCSGRKP